MIVVNFKTYPEATGYKAVELARICHQVSQETHIRIVVVPQLIDLALCEETGVECWAQHIDAIGQGKFTGWVSIEAVEEAGARGTVLNHSEHKLDMETIQKTRDAIGDRAFELCLCADSVEEAKKLAELAPNYIAYEPHEFIGSRDKSVSSERPEVIEQVVKAVSVPVLIGAGVHSQDDVKVGLKLGAKGILLATDVVLAEDPEASLRKLAQAFA